MERSIEQIVEELLNARRTVSQAAIDLRERGSATSAAAKLADAWFLIRDAQKLLAPFDPNI